MNDFHLFLNHDTMRLILFFLDDSVSQSSLRQTCQFFCFLVPQSKRLFNTKIEIIKQRSMILRLVRYIKLNNMNNCTVSVSVSRPLIEIDYHECSGSIKYNSNKVKRVLSFDYISGWITQNDVIKIGHIHQNWNDLVSLINKTDNFSMKEEDAYHFWSKIVQKCVTSFSKLCPSFTKQVEYIEQTCLNIVDAFSWINLRIHEHPEYGLPYFVFAPKKIRMKKNRLFVSLAKQNKQITSELYRKYLFYDAMPKINCQNL